MGIIHTLTEGGQIWTHRLRMLRQVIKITFAFSFFVGIIAFTFQMMKIPWIYYEGTWYFAKSYFLSDYLPQIEVDKLFWEKTAKERFSQSRISVPSKRVLSISKPYAIFLGHSSSEALKSASFATNLSFVGTLLFFFIRGRVSKSKKHVSGKKFCASWYLSLKLHLLGQASAIKIGALPLVKGTETQHTLITGGTGTGKTNCLHHFLSQIRNFHQKAVIVDTTGAFVDRYYDKNRDIILNPFDPKSAPWHPWAECKIRLDSANLAEAFIPSSYSDHEDYWRQASRALFSSALQKLGDRKKTSELVRWLLFEPLSNLCVLMQGTKAASHMDENAEKTASSIRSVASTFLECLENLEDSDHPFSIREWTASDTQDSWLFIGCLPSQRPAIRPLLSAWLSSAIRGMLNLAPDLHRRLWFILDELPTLQKVKDLETLLTEGRKYGGSAILSIQSPAQLENIYGRETTKVMFGNTLTKIVFSEQDPEIAERLSKTLGDQEIKELQEGLSYGAHESRDGVNLSMHSKFQPIVSASQIQSLKKNQAYVKLPGHLPITKIKLPIAKIS